MQCESEIAKGSVGLVELRKNLLTPTIQFQLLISFV